MRLGSARDGDVVQNSGNRSYYRFARLERGRARIRPLELFPNGLLIPKPTDTLVDADLEVALVGPWREGLAVDGVPTHGRAHYERELAERLAQLPELRAGYEVLPQGGTGRMSRGSWANKVKNCENRIAVLRAGLTDAPDGQRIERAAPDSALPDLAVRDLVQLPSGAPGLVLSLSTVRGQRYARVRVHAVGLAAPSSGRAARRASVREAPVPVEVLRPWAASALCTL